MATLEQWYNQDLHAPVYVQHSGLAFTNDQNSLIVGVHVFDNGEPATVTGAVACTVIRSDGSTVAVPTSAGTVSGSDVSVLLPAAAFTVPGAIAVLVQLVSGSAHTTLLKVVLTVEPSSTQTIIDPSGETALDVGSLVEQMEAAEAAIDAAIAQIPTDYSGILAMLAPNYADITFPVAMGAYCIYNGALYRAKQHIPSTEAWTAAHWTATAANTELAGAVRETVTMVTKTSSDDRAAKILNNDLDNCEINRIYTIGNAAAANALAHIPYEGFTGTVMCYSYSRSGSTPNGSVQMAVDINGIMLFRVCWRRNGVDGVWSEWIRAATAADVEGAVRYDIAQSLTGAQREQARENIEALKTSVIAPEYENIPYPFAAGNYCVHEGGLYYSLVDIETAETWNAEKWQYIEVGTKIKALDAAAAALAGRVTTAEGDIDTLETDTILTTNALILSNRIPAEWIDPDDNKATIDKCALNRIYMIGQLIPATTLKNLPTDPFSGMILSLAYAPVPSNGNGKVQIGVDTSGRMFFRVCWARGGVNGVWSAWKETADAATLGKALTEIAALNSPAALKWHIGKSIDATTGNFGGNQYAAVTDIIPVTPGDIITNNCATKDTATPTPHALSVYAVLYSNGRFLERVTMTGTAMYTIPESVMQSVTYYAGGASTDVAYGVDGVRIIFARGSASGVTMTQADIDAFFDCAFDRKPAKEVYYVGGNSGNPSFTQMMLNLEGNTRQKTIFIYGGAYDIFQEYQDAGIQAPPAGTSASNYFPFNAFVPPNTSIIGLGDVVLQWTPTAAQLADVAPDPVLASQIWCPLNVLNSVHVENIKIVVKNGRYCIHDDGHNVNADTVHEYTNVICEFQIPDAGYGRNNTIGFGFDPRGRYVFDGCTFINQMTGSHITAFYGHGSTATSANPAKDSAEIVVRNCVCITGNPNSDRVMRLQSITTTLEHIKVLVTGTYIGGGIMLDSSGTSDVNPFDVTLLHSGNPAVLADDPDHYGVTIYQ